MNGQYKRQCHFHQPTGTDYPPWGGPRCPAESEFLIVPNDTNSEEAIYACRRHLANLIVSGSRVVQLADTPPSHIGRLKSSFPPEPPAADLRNIPVFRAGTYSHFNSPLVFTEADLDVIVERFNLAHPKPVVSVVGDERMVIGSVEALRRSEGALLADLSIVSALAAEKIKADPRCLSVRLRLEGIGPTLERVELSGSMLRVEPDDCSPADPVKIDRILARVLAMQDDPAEEKQPKPPNPFDTHRDWRDEP